MSNALKIIKPRNVKVDRDKYTFRDPLKFVYKSEKGLREDVVREISRQKKEPKWMLEHRLKALKSFYEKPMPNFGADLSGIDFDDITYYWRPNEKASNDWSDVPDYIKKTFDKLGIPEAERKFLAGVGAQYESEVCTTICRRNGPSWA